MMSKANAELKKKEKKLTSKAAISTTDRKAGEDEIVLS